MADPFVGEIKMFGGNFAPKDWAFCNGQLMSISQNTALFSILGTTYGGNGQTTFALPDFRGRVPMHWGPGPGLTPRSQGESAGGETVTLTQNQMPQHVHSAQASSNDATSSRPQGALPSRGNAYDAVANATLSNQAIGAAGGSQPHDNMPPFLAVTFIIALFGIFPSRN